MTSRQAIAFVQQHGMVLQSARGAVPNLAEAIAGEPIRGSWWGHPRGREIFRLLQSVVDCPDILVCRLIDGKVTFVHRRLWAALVRCAPDFPKGALDWTKEEHTPSGKHVTRRTAFPEWVPPEVLKESEQIGEREAERLLPWKPKKSGRPR